MKIKFDDIFGVPNKCWAGWLPRERCPRNQNHLPSKYRSVYPRKIKEKSTLRIARKLVWGPVDLNFGISTLCIPGAKGEVMGLEVILPQIKVHTSRRLKGKTWFSGHAESTADPQIMMMSKSRPLIFKGFFTQYSLIIYSSFGHGSTLLTQKDPKSRWSSD